MIFNIKVLRMEIIPYTCFRCNYKSKNKTCMRRHFDKKKKCPAVSLKHDIELTDEIKEKILENRQYFLPEIKEEKVEPTIIKNITNYNTMYNYINNMDSIEKLDKYMNYKQLETVPLENNIEYKFATRIDKMKEDKFQYGYDLGNNRLFDIIDEISKIRHLSELNIIYDDKLKELNLFKSGSWENFLVDRGLREIILTMKDFFLDHYEIYLLRKIYVSETNFRKKNEYKEFLEEYYKFIGCFDIKPYIEDKNDCDILGDEDGDYGVYKIEELWMSKYKEIVDNMKRYEINKIKKAVDNILKNNTKKNIKKLNSELIDLITNDEEFKSSLQIMKQLPISDIKL